jgi:hypothetical protein
MSAPVIVLIQGKLDPLSWLPLKAASLLTALKAKSYQPLHIRIPNTTYNIFKVHPYDCLTRILGEKKRKCRLYKQKPVMRESDRWPKTRR